MTANLFCRVLAASTVPVLEVFGLCSAVVVANHIKDGMIPE